MPMLSSRVGRRSATSVVFLLTAVVLMPSLAAGQGAGGSLAASIIGQVRDESGGVLPGVTVTTTSAALQVPNMTAVTNEQGEYRLTPLPLGSYSVEYELAGFQTLRVENVQLTVGFVARLDQVMKVGALAETITVSGAAPLVDTTSGSTSTTLVGEAIKLIPSGQIGVHALLAQVPGVRANFDVGGSSVTDTALFIYNGQTGQVWQLFEGVLSGRQTGLGNGTKYDYTVVENARVQTAGNSAEMPKRGMMIDVVTKSGGNTLHGSGQWTQSHHRLQANNVDDSLRALGIREAPKMLARFDRSAQVGGKIIENRLWFFSSVRLTRADREVYNTFYPDGRPAFEKDASWFFLNKFTAQLTPTDKLVVFQSTPYAPSFGGGSEFVPPASASGNTAETHRVYKAEWQAVRGGWFVASLQAGLYRGAFWGRGVSYGVPATLDIATQMQGGQTLSDTNYTYSGFNHNRGVVTMYKSDWFLGNHEFKLGFDQTSDRGIHEVGDRGASGNYRLRFDNGRPIEIEVFNNPVTGEFRGSYLGVYVQDAWTIQRRLTLNLGFRVAHDRPWIPEQCQSPGQFETAFPVGCIPKVELNAWNSLAPRLHAVYDLRGDGRSVLKGGWGQFKKKREIQNYEVTLFNLHTPRVSTYRWRDLNGNRDYDPGEVNLAPDGPDFISSGRTGQVQAAFRGLTETFVNPDELQPFENEYTLSFEQQVLRNLAFRVSSVYAENKNVNRLLNPLLPYDVYSIPITRPDPGPDGSVGTADDPGTTLTYWDFPAQFRGSAFQTGMIVNDDPRNDTKYGTIEFAVTKRLAQNWQLAGSHSITLKKVPFGDGASTPLPLNPNAEINVANNTTEWITKISGSYLFPKGILGSVNYDMRSGEPLARQVLLRGGTSIPSLVVNAEPIGSIHLPTLKILDLRASKQFELQGRSRLEVYLDVFNVLNTNTARQVSVRSGPSYLRPTGGGESGGITPPRILIGGGRFSF